MHVTREKLLGKLKAGFPTLQSARLQKALHYLEGIGFQPLNWTGNRSSKWRSIIYFSVLSCFSAVFKEELGTVLGVKARIHVNPQASPIFYKARTVPFARRDKVEADLDQLLKEDIIEPVRFSNWAAPIVPVVNIINVDIN